MSFNNYTWQLYKNSDLYRETVEYFSTADGYSLLKEYNPYNARYTNSAQYNDWIDGFYSYGVSECDKPKTVEEAKSMYTSLMDLGFMVEDETWIRRNDYKAIISYIMPLSYALWEYAPDYFFPYLYVCRFFDLKKIADAFNIQLPNVPLKSDHRARCMYYWKMCEVLNKFKEENSLSDIDLCCFLYDFAPNYTASPDTQMPKSAQAWLIGGKTHKDEANTDVVFWQSNEETRKGDILIHYEKSPVSAITHIGIAQTDGIADPLFSYYSNTYIGNKIEIPCVSLDELRSDKYFSKFPLVRKNFQGVNGYSLSGTDYSELLRIIKGKGFDVAALPKLYSPHFDSDCDINIERDVERFLLEPLLKAMGLHENKDYVRQIPLWTGRGHRIFPDYALHYKNNMASAVIEAKFSMVNNAEVEKAFIQARSYALLLESSVIALCDRHFIYVYPKKGHFDRCVYKRYSWQEVNTPDVFNKLRKMFYS